MMKMLRNKKKKGFTLIELIVVVAILGILAAIAIPRFSDLRHSSSVNADATTAKSIVNAARVYETETGEAATIAKLNSGGYMDTPVFQTATTYTLIGGGVDKYAVTWTPTTAPGYDTLQTFTEGTKFKALKK